MTKAQRASLIESLVLRAHYHVVVHVHPHWLTKAEAEACEGCRWLRDFKAAGLTVEAT